MPVKVKTLPSVVFSMPVPFTESQVYERIIKIEEEVGPLSESTLRDLALTVDLYLENLRRYGVLTQNGFQYFFRGLGRLR